ncbi:peptidoglycan-binding domain-containing protein [Streptomyces anulatus]|uniref:peptidoglycan-binding domain-containing protein n=1 Tax=Streptomyces anulatus TaxID=1892 RepID=UPI0009984903
MTGHACPECGRRTAGEPGTEHRMPCRCGAGARPARLTEDEQRAARTAEIAAAEDFDPLRIRPYVTLTDHAGAPGGGEPDSGLGTREGTRPDGTWEGTRPAGTWEGPASGAGPTEADAAGAAATTMPLFLGGDRPDAGVGMGMGGTWMPGTEAGTGAAPAFGPDPVQPRRRRPFGALAVGAAVAAVVGTAAFAGGLFGGDESRDEALPEATTSVPDTEDEPAASVAPSPSASATPSRTRSASATPSASPSASASPTRSPKPTPSATASASPTASASSTPDGGAPQAPTPDAPSAEPAGPSLRPGDRGPEVVELQNRLRNVGEWLYPGPSDGNYTDQLAYSVAIYQSYKAIQGDATGTYGPNTRRALEAETSVRGPGRR